MKQANANDTRSMIEAALLRAETSEDLRKANAVIIARLAHDAGARLHGQPPRVSGKVERKG